MKLIFEEYVKENRPAFISKVMDIAGRLNVDPNWLMAVMWKESLLNPRAVAQSTGASGLIGFMPRTALDLGTTVQDIRVMSNVEQLNYVFKFYKPYRNRIMSYPDLYKVTFFPIMLGKPANWVLQTKKLSAATVARYNPVVDLDKNGEITVKEFEEYTYRRIPAQYLDKLKKKSQ